jgi:AcrR family transcriptional regulator
LTAAPTQEAGDGTGRKPSLLRRKQTARRKAEIVEAAASLFGSKGYQQTRIEDIAELANVGVATVYKYFGAKGALIREVLRPQIDDMRVNGQAVIASPADDPADAVIDLLASYDIADDWQQRDLLRAVIRLDLGYSDVFEGLRDETEDLILFQIEKLLEGFQRRGKVAEALNLKDVAVILSGMLSQHLQHFTHHAEVTREQTGIDLRRRIKLVFEAWRR